MLAILIYIANLFRRALRKLGNGFAIIMQSFQEAQEIRRSMRARHTAE